MSSESSFESLTNKILESADLIANRVEEGIAAMMTGTLPGEIGSQSGGPAQGNNPQLDDDDIMMEMDEDMIGSPLEGIADSVLSDIMSKQVCAELSRLCMLFLLPCLTMPTKVWTSNTNGTFWRVPFSYYLGRTIHYLVDCLSDSDIRGLYVGVS